MRGLIRSPVASAASSTTPSERSVLIGILAAELILVGVSLTARTPMPGVVAALLACHFLIAFRSPDLAWALTWLAVPLDVEALLPGGSAITVPTEPMIVTALLAWAARGLLAGRWKLPASPLHRPLLLVSAFVLLSTLWSVRPAATLKSWAMMAGYAAFGYLYFFLTPCDRGRRERWIRLVAVTGAVWGIFGAARVLAMGATGLQAASVASTYAYGAFRPFFSEHGTYSAYLSMLLPLTLLAAMESSGRSRVLFGGATFCIVSGLVLSFARAGWLACAIVVPATVLLWAGWRRAGRRLIIPAVIGLAAALLIGAFGVTQQVGRHAATVVSPQNLSNIERLNRWNTALSMARERPLTGVGYACYLDAYRIYRSKRYVTDQTFIRMGVHSEPLKLLCELGVLGFLVVAWFLAAVCALAHRCFRRLADPGDRVIVLGAMAGVATYFINGLFNAYLVETKVTLPFWIGIGVVAALGRRLRAAVKPGAAAP